MLPNKVKKSVQSLALYLTESANNDLEKVRAIYRWLTQNIAYDTKGYFTGHYGDLSPEGVLKSGRAVCSGYAGLFESLGRAAGLELVKISGYSKGYNYSVGTSFNGPPNHAWNAVRINGKWQLFDATWGAGHLDNTGKFIRKFQEHYFLTPPEEFIYDHFPENPQWQLLEPPISMQEYENLVYLRPAFFQNGLAINSHPQSVIETDGEVVVFIKASEHALLTAQLKQNNQNLDNTFTFVQKSPGTYKIQAVLPQAGKYVLRLFTKIKEQPGMYTWALDYKIVASKGMPSTAGFPFTYSSYDEFGVHLYQPISGHLKSGNKQTFKLKVPEAEDVAVIMNGNWHHLQKTGDLFEGEIVVEKGKTGVYAKLPGRKQYMALLEYKDATMQSRVAGK